jgi:adenylosuccinate lyase
MPNSVGVGSHDALSPLDGRYAGKLQAMRGLFSEAGLMRERVRVECAWLLALLDGPARRVQPFPQEARVWLERACADPADVDVAAIKAIEAKTNHDVKAVEYWIRAQISKRGATAADLEWVHFGCTSEDINNLAYALMLDRCRRELLLPMLQAVAKKLDELALAYAAAPMLARTHGQPATPTTVGKEFANFTVRLERQIESLAAVRIMGKMNGAVGNFNAHIVASPEVDWRSLSEQVIAKFGLGVNTHTTQIEPHDWIAEYCHALARANTILIDLARDVWGYTSLGYLQQLTVAGEVGSSTMPHKVNPIDFENAEGNLGIANCLLIHFADKLPISRWQRDLSDSTVLRNLGVAFGHAQLGYDSLQRGLGKIELNNGAINADLDHSWEVLTEAVQTVMRLHGLPNAYEQLKAYSRGKVVDRQALRQFIESLPLPSDAKSRLLALTPQTYIGLAAELARRT